MLPTAADWPGLVSSWAGLCPAVQSAGWISPCRWRHRKLFLDRDTLLRQSGAGRIQLVGFRSRLLDIRLQRRVCPFFFGQFQTCRRTVQAFFTLGGFRSLFGFFFALCLSFTSSVRSSIFRSCPRNPLSNPVPLPDWKHSLQCRPLDFHHQTITGHGLGDFGFCLQFFQSSSPPIGQRPVSMSAMYLRIGNTCGGETALPSVFIRLLRFGTSSVRRGMSAGSLAQRECPSICAGNPSATLPSPG